MSWGDHLSLEELCDLLKVSEMYCDTVALAIVQKRAADNAANTKPAGLE
jgi:hypothetical protein